MSNRLCDWCNQNPGSTWTREIEGKKYESQEKFCSLKCKSQYEDRYSISWKKKTSGGIIAVIVIIIIIYILSQQG
jgi:hypothetical protein